MSALHAMLLQLAADNVMNDFDEIFKNHSCLKSMGSSCHFLSEPITRAMLAPAEPNPDHITAPPKLQHHTYRAHWIVSCPTITLHRVGARFALEL